MEKEASVVREVRSGAGEAGTERNSAVEVLRIAAMLAIVLSHGCVHSGFALSGALSLSGLIVQWGVLGNLGTNVFVLISGYYLCTKADAPRALSRLFTQLWFYSVGLFLLCRFGFGYSYSPGELLRVFLPGIFGEYWFFTAYAVLVLLSPWLNILIREATRTQLLGALLCMGTLWVLVPTFTAQKPGGGDLPHFVMLYTAGAYLRKYPHNPFRHRAVRLWVAAGSFGLLLLSTPVLDWLGMSIPLFRNRGTWFYGKHSLLTVGCALGLFAAAVYRKPFYNGFLNAVSGCTFGVYLIHDNPALRQILWKQLLPLGNYFGSPLLAPMLLGSAVAVFTVCTLIEFLRQKNVAKPMTAALDRLVNSDLARRLNIQSRQP